LHTTPDNSGVKAEKQKSLQFFYREKIMADVDIKPKALDALIAMNTAIKNVRLYPPTSATITNTIEKLHQIFLNILEQEAPIVFAESEKSILICGKPLDQKEQEKAPVTALLTILLNFGIRSISFDKGLEKSELSAFMELLSKKPEVVRKEGDLPKIMAGKKILHIYLDQKVYVSMEKDQEIVSTLDMTDDQIAQFLMSAHPELVADSQKLQEIFKDRDPEWILKTYQAGLSQLRHKKEHCQTLNFLKSCKTCSAFWIRLPPHLIGRIRTTYHNTSGKQL
jgi:hypothetical protein